MALRTRNVNVSSWRWRKRKTTTTTPRSLEKRRIMRSQSIHRRGQYVRWDKAVSFTIWVITKNVCIARCRYDWPKKITKLYKRTTCDLGFSVDEVYHQRKVRSQHHMFVKKKKTSQAKASYLVGCSLYLLSDAYHLTYWTVVKTSACPHFSGTFSE